MRGRFGGILGSMSFLSGAAAAACPQQEQGDASPFRIGIVPYLNVQPLIWGLDRTPSAAGAMPRCADLVAQKPRQLAESLRGGLFDAATVPVFEYLRNPAYRIVSGLSIACRGPVRSVILFSDTELARVRTVILDPASLTSVNLLRVLLAESGLRPEFAESAAEGGVAEASEAQLPEGVARLLIGDPALAVEGTHAFEYDLGRMWEELTGLPFVFAVWLVPEAANADAVSGRLREAAAFGLARLEQVAAETASNFGLTPEAALRYFRENVRYTLDTDELAGLGRFAELAAKHGLIPAAPSLRLTP